MSAAHVIETLEFDLAFRSEAEAWAQHGRWGDFAAGRAVEVIGEEFDAWADAPMVWRVDRLEVDLGPAPADESEADFEARLRAGLRRSLERLSASPRAVDEAAGESTVSFAIAEPRLADADLLWRLVHLGRLPWSAAHRTPADLDALVARVLEHDGAAFAQALRAAPDMSRLMARIAGSWALPRLEQLLGLLPLDRNAAPGAPAVGSPGGGATAQAWERALVLAAADPQTDPQVLIAQAAQGAFRSALRDGRVAPVAWAEMLRRDAEFVLAELRHADLPKESLERLARTLTLSQWRDLLAVSLTPADRDLLAGLVDDPWPWRLQEGQSLGLVAQALGVALLTHLSGERDEATPGFAAVAALVRAVAALDDRPVPQAARALAAQWPQEGPLAALSPRLLPILDILAGHTELIAEPLPQLPARAASDPDWARLEARLAAADLDEAAWNTLREQAPLWLARRLRVLGRRVAWRDRFATGLSPTRLIQLLALWLPTPAARWLAGLATGLETGAPAVTSPDLSPDLPPERSSDRAPGEGADPPPGPRPRDLAAPDDSARARRWLLDEVLLAPSGAPDASALVEALARRKARDEGHPLAATARALATAPWALEAAEGRPEDATSRLAQQALARLRALGAEPVAASPMPPASERRDEVQDPLARGKDRTRLKESVLGHAASPEWRQALAEQPRRLRALLTLWLSSQDAQFIATLVDAAAGASPHASAGGAARAGPFAQARRWVVDEILDTTADSLTAGAVIEALVGRAAEAARGDVAGAAADFVAIVLRNGPTGAAARLATILRPPVAAEPAPGSQGPLPDAIAPAARSIAEPPAFRSSATRQGEAEPSSPKSTRAALASEGLGPDPAAASTPPSAGAAPGPGVHDASAPAAAPLAAPADLSQDAPRGAARDARRHGPGEADVTASAADDLSQISEGDLLPPEAGLRRISDASDLQRRDLLARLRPRDAPPALDLVGRLEAAWGRLPSATTPPPLPPASVGWPLLLREFFEEDRLFDAAGLAQRWFATLTDGAPAADIALWRAALAAELASPDIFANPEPAGADVAIAAAAPAVSDAGAPPGDLSAPTRLMWPGAAPPALEPGESLYVANAGLVLAGPYIPTLFERLDLLHEGAFRDVAAATYAADILQLIVDGADPAAEHELLLNKLICGLDLDAPLRREREISAHEREVVHGLLEMMIQRWSIIGSTSVAGLRESFLQRRGVLRDETDAWRLTVEPRAFDMLLDQIPWGFRTLKLPWMSQVVHVDWR